MSRAHGVTVNTLRMDDVIADLEEVVQ
jgi:hypothetical protein